MKRTCPACRKPFLKGRRVQLATSKGLRPALVCSSCGDGGITIVQDRFDAPRCIACGKRAASHCGECALDMAKLLKRGVK